MNSPVQKIKERMSIEDVVSSYIKLESAGVNLRARCPFHNEKTPSFFVSPARGSYYCFGCSAGGDIFTFVEEFEGLDFRGALKLLAEKAGVSLQGYEASANSAEAGEKERLYKVMEESTKYFENNLVANDEVKNYITSRGLTEQSVKDFRIGFAKLDWRLLCTHLSAKGFTDIEMEKAGLVKKTDKGFYDRFRGRIMFPISDSSGRVIAFSGRIFEKGLSAEELSKSAKYLNSPETPIFNKSSVLFGIDKAKESIRKNNFSILVEGQMDLILSHQAGFKNTVASSGTALSDATISKGNVVSNLGLIRRLSNNIVLAFDADKAGLNASNRAGKIALSLGMDVKVASMPEGVDPADLISKNGVPAWKEAIRNSKHLIEFFLDRACKIAGEDERKMGREIKEKVLPYVASLESAIEKMHFLKLISDKSSIPTGALETDLKKIEQDMRSEYKEVEEIIKEESKVFKKDYIERKLLGIILWQKSISSPTVDVDLILKELADIFNKKESEVLLGKTENAPDLIFEAEVFYGGDADLKKDVRELLENLKLESLKEELSKKMRELKVAEGSKDVARSTQILKDCQVINEKIQNIKSKNPK